MTRSPLAAALALLIAPSLAGAALVDPAFTETPLVTSDELQGATSLAWAPDGSNRLFVTRKNGVVLVVKNGVLLATPFVTVTPLYDQSECGLLGIAFDPDFLANRHVYLFVTVSATEQQIIRYTVNGDIGTDKTIIVPGLPALGNNHDGGALGLGADGKIYWGIGDLGNGTGVNADLASMAAKIGRANLDGTPPGDNPFVDGAGPNADHIWARGFRNPFTLTFQPATGLLWIQSVGNGYEQIFIVRRGDHAGWNLHENNQPDGFIPPVIKYRTNGNESLTIAPTAATGATAGASRTGGIVTFTTLAPHGFRLGEKITVAGVDAAVLNGDYFVASIPSATSFRAPRPGPDIIGGGGAATTQDIGGCVTGGAFYDATGFPTTHRGNFFFGDYNSGRIERVVLDAGSNVVSSVDHWAEGVSGAVDMALGPDGALYYVGLSSRAIYRASYNATSQGLVVSPTHLWVAEGQRGVVTVRLAVAPAADVAVSAAPSGGDTDLGVVAGTPLTFTTANWSTPQPITVAARRDLDASDDVAMFEVRTSGLPPETVTVHMRDDNGLQLRLSAATLALDEGMTGSFTAVLTRQPSFDVPVTAARTGGDGDLTVSAGTMLLFTRDNWSTPQSVTVAAASDADATEDAATITVSTEGLPPQTVEVTARDDDPVPPDAAPDGPPDAGLGASPDGGAVDAPTIDAAPRDAAAAPRDAAADTASRDAAGTPVSSGGGSGCDCRAAGPGSAGGGRWLAGWLLVAWLFQRRKNPGGRPRKMTPR